MATPDAPTPGTDERVEDEEGLRLCKTLGEVTAWITASTAVVEALLLKDGKKITGPAGKTMKLFVDHCTVAMAAAASSRMVQIATGQPGPGQNAQSTAGPALPQGSAAAAAAPAADEGLNGTLRPVMKVMAVVKKGKDLYSDRLDTFNTHWTRPCQSASPPAPGRCTLC